jgi:competence protein ComEA
MLRLITLLLCLALTATPAPAATPEGCAAQLAETPLDLNQATAEQLDQLPGIGPALAERIIDWRDEHGPFTTVDQLNEVRGIGERTVARVRPCLAIE